MAEPACSEGIARARECCACGMDFIPMRHAPRRQRFCSKACQKRDASNRQASLRIATCEGCAKTFSPKRTDRGRFCSRECAFAAQRAQAKGPTLRLPHPRYCLGCDTEVGKARRYCDGCRTKRARLAWVRPPTASNCVDCGTMIIGNGHLRRCTRCRDKRERYQKATSRKLGKLRLRTAVVESVNPLTVLRRDKWRCQLCGVKTPERLRGSYDDRAPEVDHIIPLAQGGEHSYRNTQCACRKCNISKASQPKGQMRLFG